MTTEAIIPQLVVRVWNSREATHIRLEDDIGNSLMDSSFSEVSDQEVQRIVEEAVRRSNAYPALVAARDTLINLDVRSCLQAWVDMFTPVEVAGTEGSYLLEQSRAALAGHAPAPEPLLISTLKLARSALNATIGAGPTYDWNADPGYITLVQGEAFRAIDAALALRGGREAT